MRIVSWLVISIICFWNTAAFACSCSGGEGNIKDFLDTVDVVFIGYTNTMPETIIGPNATIYNPEYYETKLRAVKGYKGIDDDDIIVIRSDTFGSSCGMAFRPHELHLVRARRNGNYYETDMCTDTAFFDSAIISFFKTGKETEFPSENACFRSIKNAYENKTKLEKLDINPICEMYKSSYDKIYKRK